MKYALKNVETNDVIHTMESPIAYAQRDRISFGAAESGKRAVWEVERLTHDLPSNTVYLICRLIATPRDLDTKDV
jgi:hypothetical protein